LEGDEDATIFGDDGNSRLRCAVLRARVCLAGITSIQEPGDRCSWCEHAAEEAAAAIRDSSCQLRAVASGGHRCCELLAALAEAEFRLLLIAGPKLAVKAAGVEDSRVPVEALLRMAAEAIRAPDGRPAAVHCLRVYLKRMSQPGVMQSFTALPQNENVSSFAAAGIALRTLVDMQSAEIGPLGALQEALAQLQGGEICPSDGTLMHVDPLLVDDTTISALGAKFGTWGHSRGDGNEGSRSNGLNWLQTSLRAALTEASTCCSSLPTMTGWRPRIALILVMLVMHACAGKPVHYSGIAKCAVHQESTTRCVDPGILHMASAHACFHD